MWTRTAIGVVLHAVWFVGALTFVERGSPTLAVLGIFLPAQLFLGSAARVVGRRSKQLPKGPARNKLRLLSWVPIVPFVLVIPLSFLMYDELERAESNERADEIETAAATTIGMSALTCFGETHERFLETPYEAVDCTEGHAGQVISVALRTSADRDDAAFCDQSFLAVVGPKYRNFDGWWMAIRGPADAAGNHALNCVFIHGGHYINRPLEGAGNY